MRRYFHTILIVLTGSLLVGIIFYASYANYMSIQENVIRIEQNQLLTLAETVSNSIESFFVNHQRDLEVISKNSLFLKDYEAYLGRTPRENAWRLLDDYYQINKEQVESIGIVDSSGEAIYAVPLKSSSERMYADLKAMAGDTEQSVGAIYKEGGELYLHLLKPIAPESGKGAVLYMRIRLQDIYRELVAPVRAGDKGYASVKDAQGVLIMHPNTSDLGVEVLEARRGQYPDFDWSELEDLVEKQRMGQSGVGVYHSLWFKDEVKERVKKFSAYTPAVVGDTFWIVTISKDYLEVVSFLKERTYTIIIVNFAFLVLFVSLLLIYFRMHQDRKALTIQKGLTEEVGALNVALEQDIDMRKVLEIELIKSKEWYENIFNGSSDYILITEIDDNGRPAKILEANEMCVKGLGYSKRNLEALRYEELSQRTGDTAFDALLPTGEREGVVFEDTLKTADGNDLHVEVNLKVLDGPSGKQCVMVARDMTGKKAQEAALKRSAERFRDIVQQVADRVLDFEDLGETEMILTGDKERFALELESINIKLEKLFKDEVQENRRKEALMIYQARLAAMGEMIGSIAHQWRQPLSVMQMLFSNVLDAYQHGELDEALLRDQHQRMNQLTRHMSETIDDFRYFFNPNAEACDFLISKTIAKSLQLLDDAIKQKGIALHLDLSGDRLIRGYENQLSQVLLSVFQNSLEALQSSTMREKDLWIQLVQVDQGIIIGIEDSAGGVAPEVLEKLFDAHFSTKKSHQGTGLGLYIAKVIIEKNFSGKIESRNGERGLLTTITIPVGGTIDGTSSI